MEENGLVSPSVTLSPDSNVSSSFPDTSITDELAPTLIEKIDSHVAGGNIQKQPDSATANTVASAASVSCRRSLLLDLNEVATSTSSTHNEGGEGCHQSGDKTVGHEITSSSKPGNDLSFKGIQ